MRAKWGTLGPWKAKKEGGEKSERGRKRRRERERETVRDAVTRHPGELPPPLRKP